MATYRPVIVSDPNTGARYAWFWRSNWGSTHGGAGNWDIGTSDDLPWLDDPASPFAMPTVMVGFKLQCSRRYCWVVPGRWQLIDEVFWNLDNRQVTSARHDTPETEPAYVPGGGPVIYGMPF